MKIKQPTKLKIGTFSYKIKLVEDLIVMAGNIGEHRPHTLEIVIDTRGKSKTPVFLHECLHAICENYKVDLADADVDRLSHGMAELLDNLGVEIDWKA